MKNRVDKFMIRSSIVIAAIIGTSIAAFAAYAPERPLAGHPDNVSVAYKTNAWPAVGPIVIEYCGLEDCSDTPQNDAQ